MQQLILFLVSLVTLAITDFIFYLLLKSRFAKPAAFLIVSGVISLVVFGSLFFINASKSNGGATFDVSPNYFATIVELRAFVTNNPSGSDAIPVVTIINSPALLQLDKFLEANSHDWNYSLGGYAENLYHFELTSQNGDQKVINIRKSDKQAEIIFVIPGYQKSIKTSQVNELLRSLGVSQLLKDSN